MAIRTRMFPLALAAGFLMLPIASHAKGADGVVLMEGKIEHASSSPDAVLFEFTGKVSFSFFSAAPGDPASGVRCEEHPRPNSGLRRT